MMVGLVLALTTICCGSEDTMVPMNKQEPFSAHNSHKNHHNIHKRQHLNYTKSGLDVEDDTVSIWKACSGRSVVAFGDSLTHGYIAKNERIVHPYSLRLAELLGTVVFERGQNGAMTGEMVVRLPTVLEEDNMADVCVVIILGGTNDLTRKKDASEMIQNLKMLHQIAQNYTVGRSHFIYTVAITIPENGWGINETARLEVNRALREYTRSCPDRMALLDLEHEFTQSDPTNAAFWFRDMGHFSSLGYDTIGEKLFEVMKDSKVRLKAADGNERGFC